MGDGMEDLDASEAAGNSSTSVQVSELSKFFSNYRATALSLNHFFTFTVFFLRVHATITPQEVEG